MEEKVVTSKGIVALRIANETDAPAYRLLRLEALKNHPLAFAADYDESLALPEAYWVGRLKVDRADSWLATFFADYNGELVGTCGIFRSKSAKAKHEAEIIGMYVHPEWRGLGLAEGMLAICEAWAKEGRVKVVKLGVVATNTAAIRCYVKCGYQVYGVEPLALFYEGLYYDELLMAKQIL